MKKGYTRRICFFCLILALFLLLNGCAAENGQNTEPPATTEPDISTYLTRIAELEAERNQLREVLKEIAKFADSEYEKRIPAPSCVEFSTVKRYAEKALKGAGE